MCLCSWRGELSIDEETVTVLWDDDARDSYIVVGAIEGGVVRWGGPVWLHIMQYV